MTELELEQRNYAESVMCENIRGIVRLIQGAQRERAMRIESATTLMRGNLGPDLTRAASAGVTALEAWRAREVMHLLDYWTVCAAEYDRQIAEIDALMVLPSLNVPQWGVKFDN